MPETPTELCRVSQLDLSLEASVSQRQTSFIESGRSVPGRHTILSLDNVSRILLQRVYRESVGHVIDDNTRRLLDELLAYPDVPRDWKAHHVPSATPTMPVIPLGFVSEGVVLRYFSMVTSVGTPQTIAAQLQNQTCNGGLAHGQLVRRHLGVICVVGG
jgi:hypothetical protein